MRSDWIDRAIEDYHVSRKRVPDNIWNSALVSEVRDGMREKWRYLKNKTKEFYYE